VGYKAVTLGDEDVEWIDEDRELIDSIWTDETFREHVEQNGLTETLEAVTRLHRVIANQLIERAISRYDHSAWSMRAINLAGRIKKRRNELRRYYGVQNGFGALANFRRDLEAKYPRAEWGSLNGGNP
jgi:hypothetical protein